MAKTKGLHYKERSSGLNFSVFMLRPSASISTALSPLCISPGSYSTKLLLRIPVFRITPVIVRPLSTLTSVPKYGALKSKSATSPLSCIAANCSCHTFEPLSALPPCCTTLPNSSDIWPILTTSGNEAHCSISPPPI